jgi:meiotic recombination protein REC8
VGSNIGLDIRAQNVLEESQRSSLFPWDHAGASSSVAGAPFGPPGSGSNRASIDRVETRLRSTESPLSRRESGSATGKVAFSPMSVGRDNQLAGDDFAFDSQISIFIPCDYD